MLLVQNVLKSRFEDLSDMVIIKGVIDRLAGAPRPHKPRSPQNSELVRYGALTHIKMLRKMKHAHFPRRQGGQNAYPRAVAEDLKQLREVIQHLDIRLIRFVYCVADVTFFDLVSLHGVHPPFDI